MTYFSEERRSKLIIHTGVVDIRAHVDQRPNRGNHFATSKGRNPKLESELSMTKALAAAVVLILSTTCGCLSQLPAPVADGKDIRFDVNDVSFLWPAPKTTQDVSTLISVDEKLDDGMSSILSQKAFEGLLSTARTVSVADSAGRENTMKFQDEFTTRSAWKIAGLRVDPSAPGASPDLIKSFGSLPQLRLIVQPVTVKDKTVQVHDVTMHLVFNYAKEVKITDAGPIAIPDKEKFAAIVQDLASLKAVLKKAGVATEGKLTVHPGFNNDKAKDFADQVKLFLKKHLSEDRLGAMAFMGIDPPEPWFFVALQRQKDSTFAILKNASIGGNSAQMLMLRGGTPVMPRPTTTNVDSKKGVSTSFLYPDAIGTARLEKAVFDDTPELKHKDIPDLIANPQRAHFFNTDCVSCHSESSRRTILKIATGVSKFGYKRPDGISGVDENVLPKSIWNVRNFGWFPGSPTAIETAALRTANEAADSAEFINKTYLNP
jgi:hypothetical protein